MFNSVNSGQPIVPGYNPQISEIQKKLSEVSSLVQAMAPRAYLPEAHFEYDSQPSEQEYLLTLRNTSMVGIKNVYLKERNVCELDFANANDQVALFDKIIQEQILIAARVDSTTSSLSVRVYFANDKCYQQFVKFLMYKNDFSAEAFTKISDLFKKLQYGTSEPQPNPKKFPVEKYTFNPGGIMKLSDSLRVSFANSIAFTNFPEITLSCQINSKAFNCTISFGMIDTVLMISFCEYLDAKNYLDAFNRINIPNATEAVRVLNLLGQNVFFGGQSEKDFEAFKVFCKNN